jgi:MFS superfamily sulfate permease-like transporter
VIAAGLFRLGWIADFLSRPVAIGVLAGIAIEIVVRQLPAILGVAGGGTTTVGRVRKLADQIGHLNGWSVAIAVGVFVVIIAAEHVSRRIPGALIGVVGSTVVVSAFGSHIPWRGRTRTDTRGPAVLRCSVRLLGRCPPSRGPSVDHRVCLRGPDGGHGARIERRIPRRG